MTVDTSAKRPRHRAGAVVIDLPRPVMDALIRLAVREDRDVVGQARRLISDGLESRGMFARADDR